MKGGPEGCVSKSREKRGRRGMGFGKGNKNLQVHCNKTTLTAINAHAFIIGEKLSVEYTETA